MKITNILMMTLAAGMMARADFSYTTARQSAQGAPGGDQVTKYYLKGQKMLTDTGNTVLIMDFDAQTMTRINRAQKSYTVTRFADMGQGQAAEGGDIKMDVKETGQRKNINGFDASEIVLTAQIDSPQTGRSGMKMQMEMDMWVSSAVPGTGELRAFYQKNMSHFPWQAMAQGNPSTARAMSEFQRKIAALNGVPVQETIRMKMGGEGNGAANDAQAARMVQARARLEEMQKQGGQQAAIATQALARMGAASGSGGSGFETTMQSANFSTAPIPDSVFAIPAGYSKTER